MLYQKLLMGSKPYFLSVGKSVAFELHRHPELELCCCIEGTCDILCESRRYHLEAGDFLVIPPMAAHEVPENPMPCTKMTVEVGYALLGDYWEAFEERNRFCRLYQKAAVGHTPLYRQFAALLEETAALYASQSALRELSIKGNLYKLSDLLMQLGQEIHAEDLQSRRWNDVKRIEKALEIIYNRYYEPLSVEVLSLQCGYSKSNFCKLFKDITGDTFHRTLNRHRVEIACVLLRESSESVERIAQDTGFADSKSFCRVFKTIMGKSAGEYRKSINTKENREVV